MATLGGRTVKFIQASLSVVFLCGVQDDAEEVKVSGMEGVHMPPMSVPEQSPSARPLEEEEPAAVSSKELGEWLRQHPTYTMDMAAFTPVSPCRHCTVKISRTKAIG